MNSSAIDNGESASPSVPGEEVRQAESFAEMMERDEYTKVRLEPGEKVGGRVVTISDDLVYVDLGGETEAMVELSEFVDEAGTRRVAEGDEVEAFFVSVQDGVRKLTTLIHGYSALQLSTIRDAWEHGQPITGDVKREVKGGFEVSAGGVRCFCPFSQIDLKGGREGGVYLGQTLQGRPRCLSSRIRLRRPLNRRRPTPPPSWISSAPPTRCGCFRTPCPACGTRSMACRRSRLISRRRHGSVSVRHVVQHLADSELVWSFRLRMVLAHDRPQLTGYDQDLWAERLRYDQAEVHQALREFAVLREANLRLLAGTSDDERRRVGIHAERGEESIAHMMRLYAGHDLLHSCSCARVRILPA